MAICNIFNKFQSNTGNFLTFSQYSEDLTKHTSQYGAYKISPSKFAVLNVNYSSVKSKLNDYGINMDLNTALPKYFQDYFENGCAYLKQNSNSWDPNTYTNLFWNTLYMANIISIRMDNDIEYINEVKYIGDINIQSHNIFGGEGFSEIYCNIPSEAKAYKYKTSLFENIPHNEYNSKQYLEGFENNDDYILNYDESSLLRYYYSDSCMFDKEWLKDTSYSKVDTSITDYYNFNTIIILYDIYITDNNSNFIKYYENIPMGIYFVGKFNGDTINSISKYISSDDIYGMGSSYGLRICSKFVPSQNGIDNTYILYGDDNNYSEFCKSLSMMTENLTLMRQISQDAIKYSQDIKNTLALFKNSKTNVPYIKEAGDKAYWFVNGKLIGESILFTDKQYDMDYAADDDIKDVLYGYE